MANKKPVEHSLDYRGIEHSQYWQGAGVAFTEWEACFTGIGDTPREAAEDALNDAAECGWDTDGIDTAEFSDKVPAALEPSPESYGEDSELHCYAVLYVK